MASSTVKEEQIRHQSIDSLPPDKLILKCKSLLTIAQKAKQAKDDAVNKNICLQEENVKLSNKLSSMETQLKTSQEMLEILTQQKLGLAMELDDLRKGKSKSTDDIKILTSKCEQFEVEAESYKRQYDKMIIENELLLKRLESSEQKLQTGNAKALHLQTDVKKLQENNEHIKNLWASESKEKNELQELFLSTTKKLQDLQNQHARWFSYLSKKYDLVTDDIDMWVACIEKYNPEPTGLSSSVSLKLNKDQLDCGELDTEFTVQINSLKSKIDLLVADKEASECELDHLKQLNEKLLSELSSVNNERDKMVHNLENVRIETQQLIENSEKLSQEIEVLKREKRELKSEFSRLLDQANVTNQELVTKVEQSNAKIENLKSESEALQLELVTFQEEMSRLNSIISEKALEIEDLKTMNDKKNLELQSLQNENTLLINDFKLFKSNIICSNCQIEQSNERIISNYNKNNAPSEHSEKAECKDGEPLQINESLQSAMESKNSELDSDSQLEKYDPGYNQTDVTSEVLNDVDGIIICKDNFNLKLKELETTLEQKHSENKKLKCLLDEAEERLKSFILLEPKLIDKEKQCSDFNHTIKALQEEVQISKNVNEAYKLQIDQLQAKIETADQNYTKELEQYKCLILEAGKTKEILLFDLEQCKSTLSEKLSEIEKLSLEIKKHDGCTKSLNCELLELKREITEKDSKLNDLKESHNKLSNCVETYNKLLLEKDLEIQNLMAGKQLSPEASQLEDRIIELQTLVENMTKENLSLHNKILKISEDSEQKTALKSLEEKVRKYETEMNDLTVVNSSLKADNCTLQQKLDEMSHNVKNNDELTLKVSDELKELQKKLYAKNAELEEKNRLWNAKLTGFKGGLIGLKQSNEDIARQFNDIKKHLGVHLPNVVDKITGVISRFTEQTIVSSKHELLEEMQHMNQALKERGELISKLQESISDNKGKIIKLTDENQEVHDQIQQVNNQLSLKEDVINNKDMLIKELENEIKKLKDMHETNTVSEGDVLSSSTINRTEEASRMKDIEESFEDKYVKLKFLAVKLKKRLSDTTHTLEVERIKNAAEKQELQEKIQTLSVAAATAQKVQATCDKVLDELEEEKRKYEETKTLLESSTKSEDNLKLQILNLESEVNKIPALQNQLESFEWSLKESKKEFKTLQTQKAEEVLKCEQLIKDKSELENKLCELNQSLQQALQQSRVNNVLELEMQNYEKTIGDLLSQLNSEKGLSKSQTKEIESLKNLVSGFEQQIKLLEGKLNVEEEKYQHLNEQLSGCHSKNNRLQALLDEQILKTDSLTKELQREKNKCETLVLECSNIGLEFKKQEKEFHLKLDALQTHAHNLENSLASAKQDLLASKNEVDHLKNEFDSYRIRAQSVLAKQKGDAITQGEKEAREQLEYMTIEMNVIRQRLDSTMSDFESLKSESSFYLSDKERTEKRIEELNKIIIQKTDEIEKINGEFRGYKIAQETLVQCYKTEIEEKDKRHKNDLKELKKKIEELSAQIKEEEFMSLKDEGGHSNDDISSVQIVNHNDSDILPLEREDGEGSESVSSPKGTLRQNILVPLDILLHSQVEDENRVLLERIEKLQIELTSYEVRTRHLSSLLSESEKDSARNSQLNLVLKEEVRRLERSIERQPHAQNTEYLKNIIIKFLTLHSCDERSRLVPVLDTILKLSPEEKHQLKLAAKGESAIWGNYLPSWTGL